MAPTAVVIVADGTEEIEAVAVIDVLRRAQIDVSVAGLLGKSPIACSRGVVLTPDVAFDDILKKQFDCVVLPGGAAGAKAFATNEKLHEFLRGFEKSGKLIGAICAAPIALAAHKICVGRNVTSHPSVEDELVAAGYEYSTGRVVQDENLLTSRAPGTALEFALELVKMLIGTSKRDEVGKPMLVQ